MHEVPIWPAVHDRIRSELSVREEGEVFLIGAGMFGKDLCIDVRERGGIALDVGSVLDHVAGKLGDGPLRHIFELHLDGVSVSDMPTHLRDTWGIPIGKERMAELIETVRPYVQPTDVR